MQRRHFLGSAALAATSLMLPWVGGAQAFAAAPRRRLLPPALNPGDTIGLVAPSSAVYEHQPRELAIDTLPEAQAALQGREIVWLSDPIDALILQIQGSGRVVVTELDGSERTVRLAFAAHNGHAYQSVGRWLLDQRAITAETAFKRSGISAQGVDRNSAISNSVFIIGFHRSESRCGF